MNYSHITDVPGERRGRYLYDAEGFVVYDTEETQEIYLAIEEPIMINADRDSVQVIISFTYEDRWGNENVELVAVPVEVPVPTQVTWT